MAYNFPQNDVLWNRGPLTTTFTPPSTCLATTTVYVLGYALPSSAKSSYYYIGLWPQGFPDYLVDTTSNPCIPPGPTPVPLGQPWYYSPGICPSSYTPAIPLAVQAASTTAWLCCPLSYTPSPDVTNALFTDTFACASTAPDVATLTSIWSAPHGDSRTDTVWPITVPPGAVTPTVVLTKPTVMAMGIPIMWENTDSEVLSWFNSYQSSSSPLITALTPTQSTTTPSPTGSTTTPSPTGSTTSPSPASPTTVTNSTNSKTSMAAGRGGGPSLPAVVLGAFLLVASFIL